MAYTHSTAHSRAKRPAGLASARRLERVLLAIVSAVSLIGFALVYGAKAPALAEAEAALASGRLVDLNQIRDAAALAPRLTVFEAEADRRFAARAIHEHFASTGATGRPSLPNVGALAAATVSAERIDGEPRLVVFRERLASLGRTGQAVAPRVAVLTAAQLAELKPSFAVRTPTTFRRQFFLFGFVLIGAFLLAHALRSARGAAGDQLILPAVMLLCAIGFMLMTSLRDPVRDVMLATRFAQGVAAGCLLLAAFSLVDIERSVVARLSYVPLAAALVLSILLVLFGSGPRGSDAKVNLLGFQPVEPIRLLVTLFLAGYFATRWELLRELEEDTRSAPPLVRRMSLPRFDYLLPVLIGTAIVIVFFFLQKDLGPALVLGCLFLGLYGIARRRWLLASSGLAMVVAAFAAGYLVGYPRTVVQRIQMWWAPWDNQVRGGDQVAHAWWAMASGGPTGAGLGLGDPQVIPAGHTDLILAALGEELGAIGFLAVFGLYAVIIGRSLRIAVRAPGDYSSFLAAGLALGVAMPVLLIAAGLLGLVPLSGVVTPFLSYGRSAMLANLAAVGLLLGIADRSRAPDEAGPFRQPLGWVAAALGVASAAIVIQAARIQVVQDETVMGEPVLTVQADGSRRFQYNPRLLAAARQIDRGTIFDRNGIPLATSRPGELKAQRARIERLRASIDAACPDKTERCYPFGGVTFHLLGDHETQINWAASNTSFAERDADARLRGYDDHARVVEITPTDGERSVRVVRRDLRELVPLWRHRRNPQHVAVRRILSRPRDLTLSIDVRLQVRAAAILDRRLAASGLRKGAAVVLDASTGALLAAVSYPWPTPREGRIGAGSGFDATPDGSLLDRARYGVYPPGSTFKLVTAAAALRAGPEVAGRTFICRRLEDGRVGNHIPGWRRPVRDDPLHRAPHGAVDLDRGLVHSCNAYFAQLALHLGAARLRETASLFDIPVTRDAAGDLRDTLPFAAYGQGQVLATALKMARVAAAMAAGGRLPRAQWILDEGEAPETATRVLEAAHAQRVADAMRAVVQSGSARGLLSQPDLVAGKTGTAEVDNAPSHSWFVGFAPFGAGERRQVAFAVVIEHGGYGARVAAPVAGDLVTAAQQLGLLDVARPASRDRTTSD